MKYSIVILIDHKTRDLPGAALIAHHLSKMGIDAHLEPLESWRSCLYAWKPDLVLFNHLLHEHLHRLSAQLHEWGVLVGCLLNEGLCQGDNIRKYLSEPQSPDLHCDLFLPWNDPHRKALIEAEFVTPPENAITVGVPRFDFYCKPWSKYYEKDKATDRTRILFNTTFALAPHYEYSQEKKDLLKTSFGGGKVPEFSDHNQMIEDHYKGRASVHEYLKPLVESNQFEITIRPHPREDIGFYQELIGKIDSPGTAHVTIERDCSIFESILNNDIILNCEDCTTSIESWMARKPTITLLFEQSPVFFTDFFAQCSPQVDKTDNLISAIARELANPTQPDFKEPRQAHLDKWLYRTDGKSALRAATAIKEILEQRNPSPSYPFSIANLRRGLKLKLMRLLNEPSHAQMTQIFRRQKTTDKGQIDRRYRDYLKAVRPSDVSEIMTRLDSISNDLKHTQA